MLNNVKMLNKNIEEESINSNYFSVTLVQIVYGKKETKRDQWNGIEGPKTERQTHRFRQVDK